MTGEDDLRKNYLRDSDLFRQPDPDEVELAYQLQNVQSVSRDTIRQMIYRYTANLYKWVAVLLFYQKSHRPELDEIKDVVREVYVKAMRSIDQFHGHASVENWLFSIALKTTRKFKSRPINGAHAAGQDTKEITHSTSENDSDLGRLPDKLRQAILLRYLFDRDITYMAHILDVQKKEAHKRLVQGRKILFGDLNTAHMITRMQAYLDGLVADEVEEIAITEQHLADCFQCQQVIVRTRDREELLSKELKARWDEITIDDNAIQMLVGSVTPDVENSTGAPKVRFTFRQAAWIAGLTAAFIGLAVLFIRITPTEEEFPSPEPTATQSLPMIIEMEPAIISNRQHISETAVPYFIVPDFSSDGSWGVFASIEFDPLRHTFLLPKIELYERATNRTRVVQQSDKALLPQWQERNFSPSISGDGRWIVFVSSIHDSNISGEPCTTRNGKDCLDIFLYDRVNGDIRRITHGIDGAAADGSSMTPTISENGRYVAFWSAASNLIGDSNTVCQPDERTILCLYIHVYERETGMVEKIKIPSILPDATIAVDRISLSADGRYAAFSIYVMAEQTESTITSTELLNVIDSLTGLSAELTYASYPNFHLDAIVYDLETKTAALVDEKEVTYQGTDSYSPVLSMDARYVAFISDSDDLVAGDRNTAGDVFVRDRVDGTIERISVDEFDLPGYGGSEYTEIGERFYNLNLSADGRYVVFFAKSPTLSADSISGCEEVNAIDCYVVYIHDRQTGEAKWFGGNFSSGYSLHPKIIEDGKWVSYMQATDNCSAYQLMCSNVMMYNLQSEWLETVTHIGGEVRELPWIYTASIDLVPGVSAKSVIAISPDGRQIAVTGDDNKIRLGQINEEGDTTSFGNQFKILETQASDKITRLEYAFRGEWLAGGSSTGKVYIWSPSEGRLLYTVTGPSEAITNIVISQDGSQLIVSTIKEIWVWQIYESHLTRVNTIMIDEDPIYDLKISPVGNLAASARGDGIVWLQTLPEGETIGRLGGSREVIHNVAFSVDGSLLVTHSSEGRLNVWQIVYPGGDFPTISPLKSFMAKNFNEGLIISPDNKFLASYGSRDDFMIWSVPGGELISAQDVVSGRWVSDLAFSADSPYAAGIIDEEIYVWQIQPAKSTEYYVQAPTDLLTREEILVNATANDIPVFMNPAPGFSGKSLDLDQVAENLHFPMMVPTRLPEQASFREAMVNDDGSLRLWYQISNPDGSETSLYIIEKVVDESTSPTMTIGASAEVFPVKIQSVEGQQTAEYVQGDWIQSTSFTGPNDNSTVGEAHSMWHWDSSSTSQRLRWQQYAILIALYYKGDNGYVQVMGTNTDAGWSTNNPVIDKLDLIQIANSMRWYLEVRGNSWQNFYAPYE